MATQTIIFIYGLASFGGYLYASTGRWDWSGIEVWRCQVCDLTDDWEQVVDNGFGFPNNWGGSVLQSFNGQLYLMVGNYNDGMEVWSSPSGDAFTWMRGLSSGFGDIINAYPYPSNITESTTGSSWQRTTGLKAGTGLEPGGGMGSGEGYHFLAGDKKVIGCWLLVVVVVVVGF